MEIQVHRPIGDAFEEILDRGPDVFPDYVSLYPAAPTNYRIAVLLGGLCLGQSAEDAARERLTGRDSPGRRKFVLGLAGMGHPLAEGYLARVLRERTSEVAMAEALRGLGRIGGKKTFPLVVGALNHPALIQPACESLASYGGKEAADALLPHVEEFPAFCALAELGAESAREAFLAGLERDPPWNVEAARGIGRLGDPALGASLIPYVESDDPALARAAFEAYARLGAPAGVEALLRVAAGGLEPWMVEPLGSAGGPEICRFLLQALDSPKPRGILNRLFRRRQRAGLPAHVVYRALRGAEEGDVVQDLAERLAKEHDVIAIREILSNRALRSEGTHSEALLALWRREELLLSYLAARVLLQAPTKAFLCEALDCLDRPGFLPLGDAPPSADRERVLEAYAQENNPCLLVGGFLGSGLVDLDRLEETLRARFVGHSIPPAAALANRLEGAGEAGVAEIPAALMEANPGKRDALARLWNLLNVEHEGADPLLDLFLCWTGSHRGGIQRAVIQGFTNALGRFIQGKTDGNLPELDDLAEHVPREGPLAGPLGAAMEKARRALMAECRDMALLLEGSQKGDMVLIEVL